MDRWVEFEEVKKAVTVEEVLSHFGVAVKWRDRPYFVLCPFHREKKPSFYVDVRDQLGYCFGCGRGGDVISIAMEFLNTGPFEAASYLAQTFAAGGIKPKKAGWVAHRGSAHEHLEINKKIVNRLKSSVRIDERARLPLVRRRENLFDELDRLLRERGGSPPPAFLRAALEAYFSGLALMASFDAEGCAAFLKEAGKKHARAEAKLKETGV